MLFALVYMRRYVAAQIRNEDKDKANYGATLQMRMICIKVGTDCGVKPKTEALKSQSINRSPPQQRSEAGHKDVSMPLVLNALRGRCGYCACIQRGEIQTT